MVIFRYSVLCDDLDGDPDNQARMAEWLCSLISIKLYVLPYLKQDYRFVIYTQEQFAPRIREMLAYLELENHELVWVDFDVERAFMESLNYTKSIDEICVRRLLLDCEKLPVSDYRLLLGTDVYFFKPPAELLDFLSTDYKEPHVLYMQDNTTFYGHAYGLRYYKKPILAGLLGDFICISPGVDCSPEEVREAARTIDNWPIRNRTRPRFGRALYRRNADHTFTSFIVDQVVMVMLFARYTSSVLPPRLYPHMFSFGADVTGIHSKRPWNDQVLWNSRVIQPEFWNQIGACFAHFNLEAPLAEYHRMQERGKLGIMLRTIRYRLKQCAYTLLVLLWPAM